MMKAESPNEEPGISAGRSASGRRLHAFILIPAIIAVALLAIFTAIGLTTAEEISPENLVTTLETGHGNERWRAAFLLGKILQRGESDSDAEYEERLRHVRTLIPRLIALFDDPGERDPSIRRYLALVLGRAGDSRAAPPLRRALRADDEALVVNALLALGMLRDQPSEPIFISLSRDQRRAVRETAIRALSEIRR